MKKKNNKQTTHPKQDTGGKKQDRQGKKKGNNFFFFLVIAQKILLLPFIQFITMHFSEDAFKNIGLSIIERRVQLLEYAPSEENVKLFKQTYRANWKVCENLWDLLDEYGAWRAQRKPEHLLWTLLFLRKYDTERANAAMVGTTCKTYRKWVWRVVEEIAGLAPMVVSGNERCFIHPHNYCQKLILLFLKNICFIFYLRLYGRIENVATLATTV